MSIKTFSCKTFMSILMLGTLIAFPALADSDPVGDWDVKVDMAGTEVPATLTVSKNDDGSLTGKLNSAMGEAELSNVTFDGTNLAFTQTFGEGDTALAFDFSGTMDGDTFAGTLKSEMGEMAVTGQRAGTGGASFYGSWLLTSESQLGTLERKLIVNPDGSGTYNDFDVSDFVLDGNKITFSVTLDLDGQELPLDFEGSFEGSRLIGEFMAEGSSVAELSGSKMVSANFVGNWEMTSDSQLGVVTVEVTVNEDATGTYGEYEMSNIAVNGDVAAFDMKFENEGQELDLAFEGTIDGKSITGEFLMDGMSVAEVTGKKLQ